MKFSEFAKCPEVKALIEEVVKHDVNNSIVSIGLPLYHLNNYFEIVTGNGDIYLFVHVKSCESDELSRFIFDYEEEICGLKNQLHLCDEFVIGNGSNDTPSLAIYTPSGFIFDYSDIESMFII